MSSGESSRRRFFKLGSDCYTVYPSSIYAPCIRLVHCKPEGRLVYVEFDLAGRLKRFRNSDREYKIDFDGRVFLRDIGGSLRIVTVMECRREMEQCYELFSALPDDIRGAYPECLSFDDFQKQITAYSRLYGKIPILPPLANSTLLFRIMDGCPYNKCTFCNFYKETKLRYFNRREVETHIKNVLKFYDRTLKNRSCSVFLGHGNALSAPFDLLTDGMEKINGTIVFSKHGSNDKNTISSDGIFTFSDIKTINSISLVNMKKLAKLHLQGVFIGIESGSEEVSALVNKKTVFDDIKCAVERLKDAGIGAYTIIMLGLGGKEYYDRHISGTQRIINEATPDRLYLPIIRHINGTPYGDMVKRGEITPLTEYEIFTQRDAIDLSAMYPVTERVFAYAIDGF